MKNFKYILSILFLGLLATGCSDEDGDTGFADDAAAPQNISALFTISQDNTGMVTITPTAEGATSFDVYYGDGTAEPGNTNVGGKVNHQYTEGTFSVKVVATGINGKTAEAELPLTVSFLPPQNLEVEINTVPGNPFQVEVSATADLEMYFTATFGEDPAAAPQQFMEGETASYTYSDIGTYTITVTAYSGGTETAVYTEDITINNPLLLPINFENPSLNYAFTTFGGATASVIDNPDASGINTSSKVGSMTPAGATWTGAYLTLDETIDMTNHYFKVKVWSPAAGVPVLLKLENLNDGNQSFENTATTTVANQWEELTFDFTGANGNYSKVVLFFNAGNPGNGDTYYFDNIVQAASGVALGFPLTFELNANYTWNNFGGANGQRITNPFQTGINTSGHVGQFVKNSGSETWAGVALPMDNPIDFSNMQKVKVKVYTPAAGLDILVKFENMNPHVLAQDIERTATTTVANQWEELTFDFTGIENANDYQMLVIFFDFDNAGTGATYYFDDVKLSN